MKAMREMPSSLIERDGESSLPPGGGLAFVIAGSLVFWAAMVWLVL